jgi:ABC-2 type transport system ATP-binding protein
MQPILEARRLTKHYRSRRRTVAALDGLDLTVPSGQVLAMLGPNGAGKTTFVRAVATLVRPDGGTLHVDGIDVATEPHRVRRLIGLAGQYASVEPTLSGIENLEMVARLFGLNRHDARTHAQRVLGQLGLADAGDRLVRTYSGGMRRRLDLGASLVGEPRLLLLDEPTTGLDPRSRIELWDVIRGLVEGGTDVLLTTQYLDEADQLASQIAIVDHGRVIADGTPAELKSQAGRDLVEVHARDVAGVAAAADALGVLGEVHVDPPTRRVTVTFEPGTDGLMHASQALRAAAVSVDDIGLRRPTLDEVFLALTGRGTDVDTPAA